MDLFEKILKDKGPLGAYSHIDDNYYMFPMLEGEIGPRMKFKGNNVLNWSLNNYLGLANHPDVARSISAFSFFNFFIPKSRASKSSGFGEVTVENSGSGNS